MQSKIQNWKFHEFDAKQLECLLGFVQFKNTQFETISYQKTQVKNKKASFSP